MVAVVIGVCVDVPVADCDPVRVKEAEADLTSVSEGVAPSEGVCVAVLVEVADAVWDMVITSDELGVRSPVTVAD